MQQLITLEVLPDGNLKVSLTPEGRIELEDKWHLNPNYWGIWADLMEWWQGNSEYRMVAPEEVGALTDSPIIVEGLFYDDEDNLQPLYREDWVVWWFPDYQVVDEFEVLLRDGYVVFTKAD